MLHREDFFLIGRITKLHAKTNRLQMVLNQEWPARFVLPGPLFLDMDGLLVPFYIKELDEGDKTLRFIAEDYEDSEKAFHLCERDCYLPNDHLKEKRHKLRGEALAGYTVNDVHTGKVGTARNILDMAHHPLLSVMHGKKEILIPFVDEIIREIDHEKKTVLIAAPEGLLDIYR